jgi:hypothetical protein
MKRQLATIFLSTLLTVAAASRLMATSAQEEQGGCAWNPTYICIHVGLLCPSEATVTGTCNASEGRCGRTLATVGCAALGGLSCDGHLLTCEWQEAQ